MHFANGSEQCVELHIATHLLREPCHGTLYQQVTVMWHEHPLPQFQELFIEWNPYPQGIVKARLPGHTDL